MRNSMPKIMVTILAVALAAVAFAGMAKDAPATIVLDKAAAKKPAVTFPHAAHVTAVPDCATCHHTQKGLTATSDVKVEPCAACHLDPEKPEAGSMREMSLTKNPFHKLCIGCHKTDGKGPKTCNDCHKK